LHDTGIYFCALVAELSETCVDFNLGLTVQDKFEDERDVYAEEYAQDKNAESYVPNQDRLFISQCA
jgi:hypothetical protein